MRRQATVINGRGLGYYERYANNPKRRTKRPRTGRPPTLARTGNDARYSRRRETDDDRTEDLVALRAKIKQQFDQGRGITRR